MTKEQPHFIYTVRRSDNAAVIWDGASWVASKHRDKAGTAFSFIARGMLRAASAAVVNSSFKKSITVFVQCEPVTSPYSAASLSWAVRSNLLEPMRRDSKEDWRSPFAFGADISKMAASQVLQEVAANFEMLCNAKAAHELRRLIKWHAKEAGLRLRVRNTDTTIEDQYGSFFDYVESVRDYLLGRFLSDSTQSSRNDSIRDVSEVLQQRYASRIIAKLSGCLQWRDSLHKDAMQYRNCRERQGDVSKLKIIVPPAA